MIEIGDHVPIASLYPKMEKFFTTVLKVSLVTASFMLQQLAKISRSKNKSSTEIKKLMLSASTLLRSEPDSSQFEGSLEILKDSNYLPCKLESGVIDFRKATDTFFIANNQYHANLFDGRLVMLDFNYEELNSLHELLQILKLDDHYISRHVRLETSADSSVVDNALTSRFRQCAYAISWYVGNSILAARSSTYQDNTVVPYFTKVHCTPTATQRSITT